MMAFSILLSISVFVQVSPVQAIWDPSLADVAVKHLDLTTIAYIDCGKSSSVSIPAANGR
jgi:hypothetical protein